MSYTEKGEYDKAIADCSKAIELDPSYDRAYYNRAFAYSEKGEVTKAIGDLEKCIELSTDPEIVEMAQELLKELGK